MKRITLWICILLTSVILSLYCAGTRQGGTEQSIEGKKIADDAGSNKYSSGLIGEEDSISKTADKEGKGKVPGKKTDLAPHGGGTKPGKEGVSGLKAGFADDNKQFNYFIEFLHKYGGKTSHIPLNVNERIIIGVKDAAGQSLPNAEVKLYGKNNSLLFMGKTYSDGTFPFFPSEYGAVANTCRAVVTYGGVTGEIEVQRFGKREIEVTLATQRKAFQKVPLDILFIMDTTGSMGEEIARLKRTIELIYLNLSSLPSQPQVRFGMVLYKDRSDEYLTKVIPLTGELEKFQGELDKVNASGGGDLPEDLQSALQAAMNVNWNTQGIRLCFVVTDAPPHLDYNQEYNYIKSAKQARLQGIKVFTVGTGGLPLAGEYVMRQISQYTSAKYIFLTYGEKDESEGGVEGSVSHHTGANYQTDKLETIIMKFAREELYNLSKDKQQADEEYFSAGKIDTEKSEETLQKLFTMAASQLADYSSFSIKDKVPTSVLPLNATIPQLKLNAEYFTEQLVFSLSKSPTFALVERKNLQGILKELSLSMSGLVDEENAAKVGKVLGAKFLVTGSLYGKGENYELFLKLVRVETAEVLSVTKAKISKDLALQGK